MNLFIERKDTYNMGMKMVCACLMVLFAATPLFAQDQQPPSADDIVAQMQAKLNLTQDQVAAVTPIIEKYSSQREELRQSIEDGTADRDSVRTQMKQLRADENQELSQVLSAQQMGEWKSMQHNGRHRYAGQNSDSGNSSSGDNASSSGDNSS